MTATNADGVGLVDLRVSDTHGNTVTTSFAVMVLSNYAVFDDHKQCLELEARVGIERSSLPVALHKPLEIKRLISSLTN